VSAVSTTVLLAGESVLQSAALRKWLRRRHCQWQFARLFDDLCKRMSQERFDLVICEYDLPDRTAFPLLDWLQGSNSTLFFFRAAGPRSTWVPVIERGRRLIEGAALKASDLPGALDKVFGGPFEGEKSLIMARKLAPAGAD
jgi:hypothetical protein